jgi:nitrogenase-associated protein
MVQVIFYEKPGCGGNARQKALLTASGHELDVRNLLAEPWTAESLRPFFGARPVRDWFNQASPRVKGGEIDIDAQTEASAIALMLNDPLLIRRPLMRVGERRESGFDQELVDAWIGLKPGDARVSDSCVRASA